MSNETKQEIRPSQQDSRAKGSGPMVGGPGGRSGSVEKAKNAKGSGKKLLKHLAPYRIALTFVMVFALISMVLSIVGPKILALATDELASGVVRIVTGADEGVNFAYIGAILLGLGAIYLISSFFSYIQSLIMAKVSAKVSYRLRNEIEQKINRLPLSYFHQNSHGDVLSRITNDVDTLNSNLSQSLTQFITSACTVVGVMVMMLTISWKMTLAAVTIVPVSLFFTILIVKSSQKFFRDQQTYLGSVNGQVEEMYSGQLIVKAFGKEEQVKRSFAQENDKLYKSAWKSQFSSSVIFPSMNFVSNLGYVVICIIGAYLTGNGSMTIGGIQAFIQYVRMFTMPIAQLGSITGQLQTMLAASERVFTFLEEPEEKADEPTVKMDEIDLKGNICFDHVSFTYNEAEPLVIKDFCAEVKAGQTVAIVGPTGAGKTTMVKLLMRFHEVIGGSIRIDGHDIRDFTKKDVRSAFGMVLQDAWLYNGTIMENIRYGKTDATDEEVIQAAKLAQADHFIRTLPDGYQMVLNEESSNISQGQKQLITIARAILADPVMMILDEATSSVDTRTELQIQKAMKTLMKGRTSFVIAHRLSTIRNADLILCMDNGDIVEQGSHDELMSKNGFYAALHRSQFEHAEAS